MMRRALDLALLGSGKVSPNPLVGCVITKKGKIIGEGYHKGYGQAHAEIEAFNSVSDKSDLQNAELFVNLEPCCHYGKTPPCVAAILKYGISKVYIANRDPNPLVSSKGIEQLQVAGIEVVEGLLEEEGQHLNRTFFYAMRHQSPYVILKWAETEDGFLARSNYDSKWISNSLARLWVHKWRGEIDAILVGTNTVLHDNPRLTTRTYAGRNPLRVLIDRKLKLPTTHHIFDRSTPTICYNLEHNKKYKNLEFKTLPDPNFLAALLEDLCKRGVQSLMVEGGVKLLEQFILLKLWHEARIFEGAQVFGEGLPAPTLKGRKIYIQTIRDNKLTVLEAF